MSLKKKMVSRILLQLLLLQGLASSLQETVDEIYSRQKENQWFKDGVQRLEDTLKIQPINKKAKGVIIVIGDGMGISTVTSARILAGQLKGQTGEENVLAWEDVKNFPHVGLSKTYNTDVQTADSAGSATAILTGVKTREGHVSVDDTVPTKNCTASLSKSVLSIIMMAEEAGLSTGIVTTTRMTHATPSAAYAHCPSRSWESDKDLPKGSKCKDIARQLIEFPYGDGLEVALGGGRKSFFPDTQVDPEETGKTGTRQDKRDLIKEWLKKSTPNLKYSYVWNETSFKELNPDNDDRVLGLFNYDHMQYAYQRVNDTAGEPALTDMVGFALKKLQRNNKGYVLLVESGRIDHAHHESKAFLALHEAVELERAVSKAVAMTDPNETLVVVTADHSHVFTIGGYQKRGSPIFGYTNIDSFVAKDGMRFTSLGYFSGPGAAIKTSRSEPNLEDLKDPDHVWQSLVPLNLESHGAEDVGIYGRGVQAHLIQGVVEQNYIFHVMDYALCLSESKKAICRKNGLIHRRNSSAAICYTSSHPILLLASILVVVFSVRL